MKQSIYDFMDIRSYTKEQLLQMLEMFYQLLQERSVTVNTQALPTYAPCQIYIPPVTPYYNGAASSGDPLPPGGITVCNAQLEAKSSLV